jgi:type II secretory pathway pseudopilin PulG
MIRVRFNNLMSRPMDFASSLLGRQREQEQERLLLQHQRQHRQQHQQQPQQHEYQPQLQQLQRQQESVFLTAGSPILRNASPTVTPQAYYAYTPPITPFDGHGRTFRRDGAGGSSGSLGLGLRSSLRKVSTGSFNSIKDALARRQRTVLNISSHCCEERCPGAAGL